jgi:type II secretory pathway pseudopilin PulG
VQNYNLKAMKNQAGMTLIELTVVLLVLIGLAGLTLPYVSGFISKTHNSTSADTGSNLFTALQRYQVENASIPSNLNALVDTTGNTLSTYLDNSWVTGGTGHTNFSALSGASTTGALASLAAAGINSYAVLPIGASSLLPDGTFSNTLSSGATFTPETLGVTPTVLVTDSVGGLTATPAQAAAHTSIAGALGYNVPTNHALIVLGVGASNTAVGKTLASVPVHFGDKGNLQPTYTYSRFLAAVDVDTTGV